MQRTLMNFDVFASFQENSLSRSQKELMEAEKSIADVLESGNLRFYNFNKDQVWYETLNHTFIRANYNVNESNVTLSNIEEVVIDEESQKKEVRNSISKMVEAILDDKKTDAESNFNAATKLIREQHKRESVKRSQKKLVESVRVDKISKKNNNKIAKHYKGRFGKKFLKECAILTKNVKGYIEYVNNKGVISESQIERNENDEIVSVSVPNSKTRNEGKLLMAQWKTLKSDLKILRESAKKLAYDKHWCKAISDLKRSNNLSDNDALEECLSNIVSQWSQVLCLTQDELARQIGESLNRSGNSNYDSKTCHFMAEGILRVAHNAYSDRVNRIVKLANASVCSDCDQYLEFQDIAKEFYSQLDEAAQLEFNVFVDLYNKTLDIRKLALEQNNSTLREEANNFAQYLHEVLDGESDPDLNLAANVANWIESIVETNLETGEWDVVKSPYETISGDNPEMAKKAKQGYSPAGDGSGNWGSGAPQIGIGNNDYTKFSSDGTNHSWGNIGGKNVYPSLSNDYLLKNGDYTMKGEPGVEKNMEDSALGMWQSRDTSPVVNNPYVPKSVMRHVNSDNKVDD